MKAFFFYFLFSLPAFVFAQCNQYYPCDDTLRDPDKYHHTDFVYNPVCGCDGKTYRNCDCAYWWGGINQWSSGGPCEEFDIDLYPNMLSSEPSGLGRLNIYMKKPGTATLQIYNSYGQQKFERLFNNYVANNIIIYDLVDVQTFQVDVYILVVIVNGEKKSLKFVQVYREP